MTTTENATQYTEAQATPVIPMDHYIGLKPGEVRVFEHATTTGQTITVSLYSVAGGSFTRLDVRGAKGRLMPERSGNYRFESAALRDYIAVLRWLVQQ